MRLQQCMNAIHGNGKWMGDFDSFVEKKKKKIREPKQEFLTRDFYEKVN